MAPAYKICGKKDDSMGHELSSYLYYLSATGLCAILKTKCSFYRSYFIKGPADVF